MEAADGPVQQGPDDRLGRPATGQLVQVALDDGGGAVVTHAVPGRRVVSAAGRFVSAAVSAPHAWGRRTGEVTGMLPQVTAPADTFLPPKGAPHHVRSPFHPRPARPTRRHRGGVRPRRGRRVRPERHGRRPPAPGGGLPPAADAAAVRPFRVAVPQADLDDLRRRIASDPLARPRSSSRIGRRACSWRRSESSSATGRPSTTGARPRRS